MSKTSTLADIVSSNSSNTLVSLGAGTGSGGGGVTWVSTVQNTSFISVKNNGYLVNTASGNVTVTLPASPTVGDNITFVDYGGNFSSNGLIFYPNGNKINANTINIALTTSSASIGLVYTDNNKGWVAYNGFQSSPVASYPIEYLVVAGAGGGASGYCSGGGGAGGMLTGTSTFLSGVAYTVSIGAGGAGVPGGSSWPQAKAASGGNSSISNLATAIGGGGGAGNDSGAGLSGGSGGGGSAMRSNGTGGAGTAGQGNPGGNGQQGTASHGGGGGGGAGATGSVGTDSAGGTGGIGATSSISGSSVYYAGGGGGGTYYNQPTSGSGGPGGPGGSGGGGRGGQYNGPVANPGTTNTGGGGGGGAGFDGPTISYTGGNGGSGVVIIRYLGPQRASGGDYITTSGGYTIHTFNSGGTFRA